MLSYLKRFKKVCAQYLTNVPPERLINLKNEFKINKAFHVSQDISGSAKNPKSYESQVNKFSSFKGNNGYCNK